ncbi:acetyl-CoA carboxylase biotin carboxyl carrier protein subunit [Bdellovibrionota bacterium FG-2]
MSGVKGRVGSYEIEWLSIPRGLNGMAHLKIAHAGDTQQISVSWRRDEQGLWLELPWGVVGFDLSAEQNDEGVKSFSVSQRGSSYCAEGLIFTRGTQADVRGAQKGNKKGVRVRAQMPGKMIRVSVKDGESVEKGQSVAVMEAMKMENEIRAPATGKVSKLAVKEGQAVESGADLFWIEPA